MLVFSLILLEGIGNGFDGVTVIDHSYLDGIRLDVVHHGFYLSFHDFRLYVLYAIYTLGVLYGDGCNGRSCVYA